MMKLVFASNNLNKIKEIQQALPPGIEILSLQDIGCQIDIPETGDTIEANADLKADFIKRHYGYNCFADDSGLLVDALGGAPGVYSARYAGEHKSDQDNLKKLLKDLEGQENRQAHFKTVITLHYNGQTHRFTGEVHGQITTTPEGEDGFGYDPIFKALGMDKTFAQIDLAQKNSISHRGKAVKQLIDFLEKC